MPASSRRPGRCSPTRLTRRPSATRQNKVLEQQEKAGQMQLGSTLGALGGAALGAQYGAVGGPLGSLIGGAVGAIAAGLFD